MSFLLTSQLLFFFFKLLKAFLLSYKTFKSFIHVENGENLNVSVLWKLAIISCFPLRRSCLSSYLIKLFNLRCTIFNPYKKWPQITLIWPISSMQVFDCCTVQCNWLSRNFGSKSVFPMEMFCISYHYLPLDEWHEMFIQNMYCALCSRYQNIKTSTQTKYYIIHTDWNTNIDISDQLIKYACGNMCTKHKLKVDMIPKSTLKAFAEIF